MIVYAYSDIFARYLLGDEKNKDLLLSFINAVNEDYHLPLLKEVVIKNLGEKFKNLEGVAGGAILGNGRIALILDIHGIVRENVVTT